METCKTVEMIGPCGRTIVNESDVKMYKGQGYKMADGGADPTESKYTSMTVALLREELERRELSTAGNKPELIAALEANDAENAENDDDDDDDDSAGDGE